MFQYNNVAIRSAFFLGMAALAVAGDGNWTLNNTGNWSVTNNWENGLVADGAGSTATLTNNISAARIVTIDTVSRTLGNLFIGDADTTHAFTLAASGGARLTFDNGGSGATFRQTAASRGDTVSAPLALADSLALVNDSSNLLTISGTITGAAPGLLALSNEGTGNVTLSGILGNGAGILALVQQSDASLLTLGGANTFTGGLRVIRGRVAGTTSASAFGAISNIITLGASEGSDTVQLIAGHAGPFANPILVASGNVGAVTLSNSANSTISGPVTLASHDLNIAAYYSATAFTLSGRIAGSGNLWLRPNGGITLSDVNVEGTVNDIGIVTGGYARVTLGLVGSNVTALVKKSASLSMTVTGPLTVNADGTALVNNDPAGVQALVLSGGVRGRGDLVISNNSAIADGVTLSTAGVTNSGRIVNAGSGPGNALISAVIGTNVTGVFQASPGSMLTLSGANTYTGGLHIRAGTLRAAHINAGGGTNGVIVLGDSAGAEDATLLATIWNTYLTPLVVAAGNTGAATLMASNNVVYGGPIRLDNHDLVLHTADLPGTGSKLDVTNGITGTGNVILSSDTIRPVSLLTAPVNNSGTVTHASVSGTGPALIGGGVGPNVTAVRENSLNAPLTIGGPIVVNGSGLTLENNSAGAARLTVTGGARGAGDLVLRNNSGISTGITVAGGVITNAGFVINSGTGTGSVLISASLVPGVAGLRQASGSSPLLLTAANTFTGGAVIEQGVLHAGNVAGSATGPGAVEVQDGGALTGTGQVAGVVTLRNGGRLSAGTDGTAGGRLVVSNLVWEGEGVVHCEISAISDVASRAGLDYDWLVVSNALTSAPGGNMLVIRMDSLGQPLSFPLDRNYNLKVLSWTGASAVDAADVRLETNLFLAPGEWQVTNANKALWVVYRGASDANTWIGSGKWSTATNWSWGHAPLPGEPVAFGLESTANCAADSVSNDLASITLSPGYTGTVTFATNAVEGAMHLRLTGALTVSDGTVSFDSDPTRVGDGTVAVPYGVGYTVSVVNVSIAAGCAVKADKGFAANAGPGRSPDGTSNWGASHGGRGGVYRFRQAFPTAPCYGRAEGPTALGSGGQANPGGGALKLIVTGTATVDGVLSASAVYVQQNSSMGAGGSLWLTGGGTLRGAGLLAVNSGHGGNITCGGGGGRLDISGMVNDFEGSLEARNIAFWSSCGQAGSILLPLSAGSGLTLDRFVLTNTLMVGNSLTFTQPVVVTNGGRLILVANTNENVFTFTDLTIASNGAVFCQGNWAVENAEAGGSTNNPYGLGVTVVASNVTILAGGTLNAEGGSGLCGAGPGYGTNAQSAGYGGLGSLMQGATYGAVSNVTALGSGGRTGGSGGYGGGAIRLIVNGTLRVDGTNSVNGGPGQWNYPAGSGGSLWIDCGRLEGAGLISANGGYAANNYGGGGGRIHLSYREQGPVDPVSAGKVVAYGGVGNANLQAYKGAAGTVLLTDRGAGQPIGTLIVANNLIASNTATLLPTNSDGYGGSPLTLSVDRLEIRERGILQVPAERVLAVGSLFSNGVEFAAAAPRPLLSFVAETNSVLAFAGTNEAAVYGSNVFAALWIQQDEKVVRFEAGRTNRVWQELRLDRATLLSTREDEWWFLQCGTGAVQTVRRVSVRDGNAAGGAPIRAGRGSIDQGNNVNWIFPRGGLLMILR